MRAKIQACYLPILAQYVAANDVRYYLKGFLIEPAPAEIGGCYLVATNGQHIVVIHDKQAESEDVSMMEIPKRMLIDCKYDKATMANRYKIYGDKFVTFDGQMATLEDKSGPIRAERSTLIGGKYPEWRKVLPRESVATENVVINPKFLSIADSALKKSGLVDKNSLGANIELFGNNRCIAFFPSTNSDKHEIMIIIMPMRDDKPHSIKSAWMQNIDKRWEKPVPVDNAEFPQPNAMGFYEHDFSNFSFYAGGNHE